MENKKVGLGAGALILIVVAFWALSKKPVGAVGISSDPYAGTIYEGMSEAQAWAYYYQRKAEIAAQRAIAIAEAEAYIADPEKVEAEHLAELGITKAELPTYQDFALLINMELGGSYVNGVLTPPDSWTGTVTGWSKHVQESTFYRYHQMYG